jgi:hypothetical protein
MTCSYISNSNCWDGEPIWRVLISVTVTAEMVSRYDMFLYQLYIVYFINCIGYLVVLLCAISVIMMEYTILYRENTLSSEQKVAYSLLCCTDQTADSSLMQLWIFVHQTYVFFHLISISIQKNLLCHSVTVSLCALFTPLQHSIHYSMAAKLPATQTM